MKTRLSSHTRNKKEMKTSDLGKYMQLKSRAKTRRTSKRSSSSRSRVLGLNRNIKSGSKKRMPNRQSGIITIRRSSGRKEKFNTERMAQTVSRSGVPFLMARDISKKIVKNVKNKSSTSRQQGRPKNITAKQRETSRRGKIITAGRVRRMVAKELIDRNRPDIAKSYSGNPPESAAKHINESPVDKQTNTDKYSVNRQPLKRNQLIPDQRKRGEGIMT